VRAGFRNRPRRDFTILRNAALRDARLSLKAKGMLALMMSFPDDWTYHLDHLEGLSTDGRDATRGAVRELEAAGYVSRLQGRTPDGRLAAAHFEVADDPSTVDGLSGDGSSGDGLSGAGKPAATKTDWNEDVRNGDVQHQDPLIAHGASGTAPTTAAGEEAHTPSTPIKRPPPPPPGLPPMPPPQPPAPPPPPLSVLTLPEKHRYRALQRDPESVDAARRLIADHLDVYQRLCRIAERHRPDGVTFGAWVRGTVETIDATPLARVRAALDVVLTTPNVRSPWALFAAAAASETVRAPKPGARDAAGMEARMRERYPDAFA